MSHQHYLARIGRLQKSLQRKRFSAMLISQPDNRRYLSGYTAPDHGIQESAGYLLIPATGAPYLLTDSRFTLQAEQEATHYKVECYTKGMLDLLNKFISRLSIETLAIEGDYTLYSTFCRMQERLNKKGVELKAEQEMVEKMRIIKDEQELELMRTSTKLNEKVFQSVYNTIEPGMTELEIALALELTMREMGAESPSFDTIVAFGTNAAKPHAVPSDRVLKAGELVLVDMGLVYKGYCSDMSRTFVAGKPDATFIERHRIVRQAMLAGIKAVRAGITGAEVDMAARQVLIDAGYGQYFGHGLGHGVGINVHEKPSLSPRYRKKLAAGMVVTVEPGIYLAEWGGIRLENMVVVTEEGCEVLNQDTTSLDL